MGQDKGENLFYQNVGFGTGDRQVREVILEMNSQIDTRLQEQQVQFLENLPRVAGRLLHDPFSDVTRQRQRYLLIASIITLALTFSVFDVSRLSIWGGSGVVTLSSSHLACIIAFATIYLVALFLVGGIQEVQLQMLKAEYFDKQSQGLIDEFEARSDKFLAYLKEKDAIGWRQLGRTHAIGKKFSEQRSQLNKEMNDLVTAANQNMETINELARRKKEGDEGVGVTGEPIAQKVISDTNAISAILRELTELDSQQKAAEAAIENAPDAARDNARLENIQSQYEAEQKDHQNFHTKFMETMKLMKLADMHAFFRIIVELVLPVVFATVSVILCFMRTSCLTDVWHFLWR